MDRRQFIKAAAAGGGLALLGSLGFAQTARAAVGPYGPLEAPDANGIRLPAGFVSRVIAVTGRRVGDTEHVWHPNPDGGATFALDDSGWIYVSNDESNDFRGGVSMVQFSADGAIVDSRSILTGTNRNCAGGPTPWGSWLSCEEFSDGRVWECDPMGLRAAQVRPAMGVFSHEAAAVDITNRVVYLTEDKPDGGLYRFVPRQGLDLSEGELQVLTESGGRLGWQAVPDPSASSASTRTQVASYKPFDGGEGAWFDGSHLYFTTKGDNRVWRFDPARMELTVLYDIAATADPILRGVDNVTMSRSGDLFICEDGGDMEIVMMDPSGTVSPLLRLAENASELTGVAFDPSGSRMYFSSQRNPGMTFEVSGPFRVPEDAARPTTPTPDLSRPTEPTGERFSADTKRVRRRASSASGSSR